MLSRHCSPRFGRIVLVAGVIAATSLPLSGCDTIQRETGFNRSTQWGAAGGAAFGGIVAALANANPAWIAASVILGGIAGGYVGDHLGKDDAQRHARTNLSALDTLNTGQSQQWSNAATGNSGSTTVIKVVVESGRTCKSYRETVHAKSETVTREATACRSGNSGWKVI